MEYMQFSLMAAVPMASPMDNVYTELDIGEERESVRNALDIDFERGMGQR